MKPLQHLKILELSRALACPFATMILAELGATVIKVEQPGEGDETRGSEPRLARDSSEYFACNRSKASITANLRSPEGQTVIRELAQKVDVVVEDFAAGTLARHGLDFTMLSTLNPALVYVSCTGGGPVKPGLPVADLTSGLWVAIGILAMLAGREKTGRGAHLDFSMLDGQVSLLALAAAPVGSVNDVAEILADPQVRARGLVGGFDYPGLGEFKALGLPFRFLGWDNPEIGAPPVPGAGTERVLKDLLGYSAERIEKLKFEL